MGLLMVLPILGGRWLDGRLQTRVWALVGMVLGLALGFLQLAAIAKGGRNGAGREKFGRGKFPQGKPRQGSGFRPESGDGSNETNRK